MGGWMQRLQRLPGAGWLRGATARGLWVALAMLVAGLGVTWLLAFGAQAEVKAKAQREFEFACREVQIRIDDRLAAHVQLLTSGAALFDSSDLVTRQDWQAFVNRLQVDEHLPGILGMGFSQLITPDQLADHLEQVRHDGFPDYTVWPPGRRDVYSSILYLEPFIGRNLRAFGYDMFSEPVRHEAMARARDEDAAALSAKVILVQETDEDVQSGTLMYVPVYTPGAPLDTVEQRRAALRGWVYSPYRMNDLLSSVLGDWGARQGRQRTLDVFDGDQMTPDTLLFASTRPADVSPAERELFTLTTPVEFAGRRWTLRCAELGTAWSLVNDPRVWSVLVGGAMTSLLLAGLTLSLFDTRYRARRMADQLTAELRKSEQKYRTMADFTYDWEAWRGPDGAYVYTSPACERITGHSAAEFVADPELLARIIHPADCAAWDEHLSNERNRQVGSVCELDFRIVKPSGEVRWISHTCRPVYSDDGQYLGRRASNRDSTERKLQEAQVIERSVQLAEAVAELQQAARMKDEFMAAMSHELRTPLTGILAMTEVLELSVGGALNERQARYVQAVRENAERLHDLITRILRYTDLVAGKVHVAATAFRLQEAAAAVERSIGPRAAQKDLAFDIVIDPPGLEIVSDAAVMIQTLEQLLDNAVKFTSAGERIGLEMREGPGAGTIELVVWDTGIGIARELHDRIFQPFTQVDGSLARRYEGAGLGLASVQRLVALLGGTIAVASAKGEGSRFIVTLPKTGTPSP